METVKKENQDELTTVSDSSKIQTIVSNVESATTGLVVQLIRVLNLYKDEYGLISANDKEVDEQMRLYGNVFDATAPDRIKDIHSDLICKTFHTDVHSYIGMPHLLKLRLSSMKLKDIELGSNLVDDEGKAKNRGVFLPLGPIWTMAVKLRSRAKLMLEAGSEKIAKTDLMNTGMHHILYLVVMHLDGMMSDEKAQRTCKNYCGWIHQYRILCEEQKSDRPSFSDAMNKVRGIMNGPMLQQIVAASGLDVDIDDIQSVTDRIFGGSEDSMDIEGVFNQLSSGDFNSETMGAFVNQISHMGERNYSEDEDDMDEDDDDVDIGDYDEHVTYEDLD